MLSFWFFIFVKKFLQFEGCYAAKELIGYFPGKVSRN